MSDALIFVLTNPQYDNRLFIELQVQHMNTLSSKHVVYIKLFWRSKQKQKTICVHNMFLTCSELGVIMYWTWTSMNNLLSYCGLFEAKMRASDIYLPVIEFKKIVKMLWVTTSLPTSILICWKIKNDRLDIADNNKTI